jgi:hypothetical protein
MKTQVKLTLSIDADKVAFVQQLLGALSCVSVDVWEVEAPEQNFQPPQDEDEVWDYVLKDYQANRKADWFEGRADVDDLADFL